MVDSRLALSRSSSQPEFQMFGTQRMRLTAERRPTSTLLRLRGWLRFRTPSRLPGCLSISASTTATASIQAHSPRPRGSSVWAICSTAFMRSGLWRKSVSCASTAPMHSLFQRLRSMTTRGSLMYSRRVAPLLQLALTSVRSCLATFRTSVTRLLRVTSLRQASGRALLATSVLLPACASVPVNSPRLLGSLDVCSTWSDANVTYVIPSPCRYQVASGEWLIVRNPTKPEKPHSRLWWLMLALLI